MKPINVAIVGAGAAGYFAAAAIARNCPHACVTIYHDPKTPSIGVGESIAWGAPDFMRHTLGLTQEFQWMKPSQSTYKFAAVVQGFTDQSDDPFYISYPFTGSSKLLHKSPLGGYIDLIVNNDEHSLYDIWLHLYKKNLRTKAQSRGDMNEHHWFAVNNTCPVDDNGDFVTLGSIGHSYHVDAGKIGPVVHEMVGRPHGVQEVSCAVKHISVGSQGIDHLVLDNGQRVQADLYIDCTGFQRLLIGAMDVKFCPCDEYFNDSAVVGMDFYRSEKDYTNVSLMRAMPHGWAFSVPTHNRSGNGYIFNSRINNSIDQLVEEFEKITGKKNVIKRHIHWNPGNYERCMVKNCVALGISFGFLEAFDANGFSSTMTFIKRLVKHINQDCSGEQSWRDAFNFYTQSIIDDIKFRIQCAMHLAPRNDTHYWQEMKTAAKRFGTRDKLLENLHSNERKHYLGHQNKMYSQHTFINTALYYDIPFDLPAWTVSKETETLALNWFDFFNKRNQILSESSRSMGDFYQNTLYSGVKFTG